MPTDPSREPSAWARKLIDGARADCDHAAEGSICERCAALAIDAAVADRDALIGAKDDALREIKALVCGQWPTPLPEGAPYRLLSIADRVDAALALIAKDRAALVEERDGLKRRAEHVEALLFDERDSVDSLGEQIATLRADLTRAREERDAALTDARNAWAAQRGAFHRAELRRQVIEVLTLAPPDARDGETT